MTNWLKVQQIISETIQSPFQILERQTVGGRCIHSASRISDHKRQFFIKVNGKHCLDMFASESAALIEIHKTNTIKVPLPLYCGICDQDSLLITEYLSFSKARNDPLLGEQLAALHQVTKPEFGWSRQNNIGTTPQINTPSKQWVTFYHDHRLAYQLALAEKNAYGGKLLALSEIVLANFACLFENYHPVASLLHGDLWSGNTATTDQFEPVIYDPASYYGDRETDIAMTELFAGFSPDFYSAYNSVWPLDDGYPVRKDLYKLYHVLNHLNLFGGGYESQAINLTKSLISNIT